MESPKASRGCSSRTAEKKTQKKGNRQTIAGATKQWPRSLLDIKLSEMPVNLHSPKWQVKGIQDIDASIQFIGDMMKTQSFIDDGAAIMARAVW